MDHDQAIEKLRELMKGVHICVLTNVNEDGRLVSRPMALQTTDFDGELWFFTSDQSAKVAQLNQEPNVNVAFENHNSYVSLSGQAQPIVDRAKFEELWSPAMKGWFPDGIDTPDLMLIHVHVSSAQYWDTTSSKAVTLFAYAKAAVTGKRPSPGEIGESKVVDLED